MSDVKFLEITAFVTGRDDKRKPYKIGYVKIDGDKMSGRIDGLPIGFDGGFVIAEKRERPEQQTIAGAKPKAKAKPEEDDDSVPF